MKLGLALDVSRGTADSSDVHLWGHWFWSYKALKVDKIFFFFYENLAYNNARIHQ